MDPHVHLNGEYAYFYFEGKITIQQGARTEMNQLCFTVIHSQFPRHYSLKKHVLMNDAAKGKILTPQCNNI